jgi:hypothetical protein
LSLVSDSANAAELNDAETADAENVAALAQRALPDENEEWDPDADPDSNTTAAAPKDGEDQTK